MCGIFALLNSDSRITNEIIEQAFKIGQPRGPEMSRMLNPCISCSVGFHRLAINGLNEESNQPLCIDEYLLICNGEIYNYQELYKLFPENTAKTLSDCEIIIHMYKKYGIKYTLNNLDGVFAFILLDLNKNIAIVARDPYGVRPMYHIKHEYDRQINGPVTFHGFASELKQLSVIKNFYI